MSNGYAVLYNLQNGLFITHIHMLPAFDEITNPMVPAYDEIILLKEFSRAVFVRISKEVSIAETENYIFHQFSEDANDDITWVEVKGMTHLAE